MGKELQNLELKIKELEKKLDIVLNMLMADYFEDDGEEGAPFEVHALEHDLAKLN
ncbi:MAG: hypothetical protein GOU98_04115 [Candidatus Altiarchaeota archaeon]|nr:hypothetical protein [Candidatus Altiarchaeota archaeon]